MDSTPYSREKTKSLKLSKSDTTYIDIDVPADGDCLFSASLLGLLLPCLEDDKAFLRLCQRLFGNPDTLSFADMQACLLSYDGSCNFISTNVTFQQMLSLWRIRLADEMLIHSETYKAFIPGETDGAFNAYITKLKIPKKTWGGEVEIRAIHRLSMHPIEVYQKRDEQITECAMYREAARANTTPLRLFHTNISLIEKSSGLQYNHYHYFLPTQVCSALFKQNRFSTSPLVSVETLYDIDLLIAHFKKLLDMLEATESTDTEITNPEVNTLLEILSALLFTLKEQTKLDELVSVWVKLSTLNMPSLLDCLLSLCDGLLDEKTHQHKLLALYLGLAHMLEAYSCEQALDSQVLNNLLQSLTQELNALYKGNRDDANLLAGLQALTSVLQRMSTEDVKNITKDDKNSTYQLLRKLKDKARDPDVLFHAAYALQSLLRIESNQTKLSLGWRKTRLAGKAAVSLVLSGGKVFAGAATANPSAVAPAALDSMDAFGYVKELAHYKQRKEPWFRVIQELQSTPCDQISDKTLCELANDIETALLGKKTTDIHTEDENPSQEDTSTNPKVKKSKKSHAKQIITLGKSKKSNVEHSTQSSTSPTLEQTKTIQESFADLKKVKGYPALGLIDYFTEALLAQPSSDLRAPLLDLFVHYYLKAKKRISLRKAGKKGKQVYGQNVDRAIKRKVMSSLQTLQEKEVSLKITQDEATSFSLPEDDSEVDVLTFIQSKSAKHKDYQGNLARTKLTLTSKTQSINKTLFTVWGTQYPLDDRVHKLYQDSCHNRLTDENRKTLNQTLQSIQQDLEETVQPDAFLSPFGQVLLAHLQELVKPPLLETQTSAQGTALPTPPSQTTAESHGQGRINPRVLNQYVVGEKAFPLGKANFSFIIDKGLRFIDKSLFIKDVLDDIGVDVKLIIRPRRFGKTTNIRMLALFADCTRTDKGNFFEKLKIWHIDNGAYRQHYQNYPVIFMTFKDIKPNKFDKAYNEFVRAIQALYNKHTYLSESTALTPLDKERFESILFGKAEEADIKSSLLYLSEYLHKHHGKHCLLLIDEYDTPIQAAYNHDYYDDMVGFIQSLFGAGLKGNNHMHTAVMTGILKIAKENIFSDLNNVTVYGVLESRYSAYFGFLEPEVKALMGEEDWDRYKDDMTDWYGGYQIGEHRLYNPWSVLNCIHQHYTFNYYWATAQENALIETILQDIHPTLKQRLREMVERGTIQHTIDQHMALRKIDTKKEMTETEQRNFVLGYLLLNGYLSGENKAAITKTQEYTEATLSIPNLEIYQFFYDKVKAWFPDQFIPFEFKSTTESERQFTVKNPLIRRLLGHNTALRHRAARHIINEFLYFSLEFETELTQALERSQPTHAMTELYAFSQLTEELKAIYKKFQAQSPTELNAEQCVTAGKLLLFTTETEESLVIVKPELAKPCFDQAITLDPSNDEAYCCRGIVLMLTSKQIDDALPDLQQAVQLNPNNASAHFELGNLNGIQGNIDKAEHHFKKAIGLGFNAELCYLSWGNMYEKAQQKTKATESYLQVLNMTQSRKLKEYLTNNLVNENDTNISENLANIGYKNHRGIATTVKLREKKTVLLPRNKDQLGKTTNGATLDDTNSDTENSIDNQGGNRIQGLDELLLSCSTPETLSEEAIENLKKQFDTLQENVDEDKTYHACIIACLLYKSNRESFEAHNHSKLNKLLQNTDLNKIKSQYEFEIICYLLESTFSTVINLSLQYLNKYIFSIENSAYFMDLVNTVLANPSKEINHTLADKVMIKLKQKIDDAKVLRKRNEQQMQRTLASIPDLPSLTGSTLDNLKSKHQRDPTAISFCFNLERNIVSSYAERHKNSSLTKKITWEDLFPEEEMSIDGSKIAIVGQPGVGKSTLCQSLLQQWLSANTSKIRFHVVFFIAMRNLTTLRYGETSNPSIVKDPYKSLEEIILKECFPSTAETLLEPKRNDQTATRIEFVSKWLNDYPQHVCFIIDGINEFPTKVDEHDKTKSYLQAVVENTILYNSKFSVLCTTRPRFAETLCFDHIFQLKPLQESDIKAHIDNGIKSLFHEPNLNDLGKKLDETLEIKTPTISLYKLLQTPIHLYLLCELLTNYITTNPDQGEHEIEDLKSKLKEQDGSFVLFEQYVNIWINQVMCQNTTNQHKVLKQRVKKTKDVLERIAFITLSNDTLVFSLNHSILIDNEIGEIKEIFSYFKNSHNERQIIIPLDDTNDLFSFSLHSFQEYLAACYISNNLGRNEVIEFFKAYKFNPRYQNVIKFATGMCENNNSLEVCIKILLEEEPYNSDAYYEAILIVHCLSKLSLISINKLSSIIQHDYFLNNDDRFIENREDIEPSTKKILGIIAYWVERSFYDQIKNENEIAEENQKNELWEALMQCPNVFKLDEVKQIFVEDKHKNKQFNLEEKKVLQELIYTLELKDEDPYKQYLEMETKVTSDRQSSNSRQTYNNSTRQPEKPNRTAFPILNNDARTPLPTKVIDLFDDPSTTKIKLETIFNSKSSSKEEDIENLRKSFLDECVGIRYSKFNSHSNFISLANYSLSQIERLLCTDESLNTSKWTEVSALFRFLKVLEITGSIHYKVHAQKIEKKIRAILKHLINSSMRISEDNASSIFESILHFFEGKPHVDRFFTEEIKTLIFNTLKPSTEKKDTFLKKLRQQVFSWFTRFIRYYNLDTKFPSIWDDIQTCFADYVIKSGFDYNNKILTIAQYQTYYNSQLNKLAKIRCHSEKQAYKEDLLLFYTYIQLIVTGNQNINEAIPLLIKCCTNFNEFASVSLSNSQELIEQTNKILSRINLAKIINSLNESEVMYLFSNIRKCLVSTSLVDLIEQLNLTNEPVYYYLLLKCFTFRHVNIFKVPSSDQYCLIENGFEKKLSLKYRPLKIFFKVNELKNAGSMNKLLKSSNDYFKLKNHLFKDVSGCIYDNEAKLKKNSDGNVIELGSGAYATVFLGEYRGIKVAIKTVKGDKTSMSSFNNELDILRNINHPNIIEFYTEAKLYNLNNSFVLEYIPGGTLHKLLTEHGSQTTWKIKISIAVGIAKGLLYLHNLYILHLDLHWGNILLSKSYMPKLCDFGLSVIDKDEPKLISKELKKHNTRYCAPEILRPEILKTEHSKKCSKKMDIYSFGLILGQLSKHRKPFYKIVDKVIFPTLKKALANKNEHPKFEKSLEIPECCVSYKYLNTIVKACCSIDPSKRPEVNTLVEKLTEIEKSVSDWEVTHG